MSLNDLVELIVVETKNHFSRQRILNYYIKGILNLPKEYQNMNYIELMVYAQRKTTSHFKEILRKREYGNDYHST